MAKQNSNSNVYRESRETKDKRQFPDFSLEDRAARDGDLAARIFVVGVGGSGGSAINRMVQEKIRGVNFLAVNTDAQALAGSAARDRLHIGKDTTRGLGAGMDPNIGRQAATEDADAIRESLIGADMVFITCGLGGGTGTGASPIVAEIARDLGALTVAVVTKPFSFEGMQRRRIAEEGYEELADRVDTIITIPNDRILNLVDRKTPLIEAFKTVDDILRSGVQGISEMITIPGLINVDFADVKSIMKNAGSALMGIGYGTGENRAKDAAQMAISSPLLELSTDGARGVLFTVTAGSDLSMFEVQEAADLITASVDPEAKIIFGTVIDPNMGETLKISVIATGFQTAGMNLGKKRSVTLPRPNPIQNFNEYKNESRTENKIPNKFENVENKNENKFDNRSENVKPSGNNFHQNNLSRNIPIDLSDDDLLPPAPPKSMSQPLNQNNPTFNRRPNNNLTEEPLDELDVPAFLRRKSVS